MSTPELTLSWHNYNMSSSCQATKGTLWTHAKFAINRYLSLYHILLKFYASLQWQGKVTECGINQDFCLIRLVPSTFLPSQVAQFGFDTLDNSQSCLYGFNLRSSILSLKERKSQPSAKLLSRHTATLSRSSEKRMPDHRLVWVTLFRLRLVSLMSLIFFFIYTFDVRVTS